jgi:hypothetical protein
MIKTLSPDTHIEVERIHITLIRKAPFFWRLQMVTSLVQTPRRLCWEGISERFPDEGPEERLRRFITLLYEDGILAERVVKRLNERQGGKDETSRSH